MKIKSIGGSLENTTYDAKDVLVWIKCADRKHPSHLTTPYAITQENGLECPYCKGAKPIKAYIVRFYDGPKLKEIESYSYYLREGAVTTIKEAKTRVAEVLKMLKEVHSDALHEDLIMINDLKCGCGGGVTAKFEDGIQLLGRVEGNYKSGEFFIEIIDAEIAE